MPVRRRYSSRMRASRLPAAGPALALALALVGCLPAVRPVPTLGYGEPYKGDGKAVYVKDSRNDWAVEQSGKHITSEQALEIASDQEYLARREIAKEYNKKLFAEAESRHTKGTVMMGTGAVAILGGVASAVFLPSLLRESNSTPASATEPETREKKAGALSSTALIGGIALVVIGAGVIYFGFKGGRAEPPYHVWKTPKALDRPAYVRQQTEAYNEKIGATVVAEQPGAVDNLALAPGQRKTPPPRPEPVRTGGKSPR